MPRRAMATVSRKPVSPIERVTLNRVTPELAFATVQVAGVNLMGLRVELRAGCLIVNAPERTDRNGKPWPLYAFPPGLRDAVEAEVAIEWANHGLHPG